MEELINNQEKGKIFGAKGKEIVNEKFSIGKMVKDIEKLYTDIIKETN